MQNSRAKFVQNFFKIYRILSDSRKRKSDRKCSRIKGLKKFNPNQSDTWNALGRNRTHISRTGILRVIRYTTRAYNESVRF